MFFKNNNRGEKKITKLHATHSHCVRAGHFWQEKKILYSKINLSKGMENLDVRF